jgi:hypothetical protein
MYVCTFSRQFSFFLHTPKRPVLYPWRYVYRRLEITGLEKICVLREVRAKMWRGKHNKQDIFLLDERTKDEETVDLNSTHKHSQLQICSRIGRKMHGENNRPNALEVLRSVDTSWTQN